MLQCFPLDNTEYEAAALGAWFATRTRGVLSGGDNFAVTASGTGMSVTLQPGYGWLWRDAYWGTVVWTEEPETFTLDPADGTLSRIDVIVLRLDKDNNTAQPILRKGTFSNTPTFTAPVRDTHADEIYVASILVQPGAVKILQADITDLRMDENVCGVMRDGITGIPTAQLQQQVEQLIDHLREEVAGIEQGSEVMLRTVYDPDGTGSGNDSRQLSGHAPQWWMPTGMVVPYAGAAAPDGWLLCRGQAVSRTTYAQLFSVIGTTYGSGDGSTTFNLPDMRGRVAVGSDANLGATAGVLSVSLTAAQNGPHNHTTLIDYKNLMGTPEGSNSFQARQEPAGAVTTGSSGNGAAHENRQPSLYLNYVVKV